MRWRRFGWGLLMVIWLGGCASSGPGTGDIVSVGQREADLVARKGQPQEVQPGPGGGKIYIYTTYSLDQVAAMGGGAWNKPDQVYYWLDDQGIITKVARYPYGKRSFLFPSAEKPAPVAAQAPESRETAPAPAAGAVAVKAPEPQAPPPPAPAAAAPGLQTASRTSTAATRSLTRGDMDAATRLELNMSREEVQRILGPPERTEGFRVQGRGVIVWFYSLANRQGRRVDTPLVFEEGRLGGWGENYYQRRLQEASGQ